MNPWTTKKSERHAPTVKTLMDQRRASANPMDDRKVPDLL
jgi:hypothetical protein